MHMQVNLNASKNLIDYAVFEIPTSCNQSNVGVGNPSPSIMTVATDWDQSLSRIHNRCKSGFIRPGELEQFKLDDAERYLDAKILLAQLRKNIFTKAQAVQVEALIKRVRQFSEKLVSESIPRLNKISLRLAKLSHAHSRTNDGKFNDQFVTHAIKHLSAKRKVLLSEINDLFYCASKHLAKLKETVSQELHIAA